MNLTKKGNFIINNEMEFTPKLDGLHIGFESLASDNSGRTLDGVMHIYWVFNKIRKLEIEMPPMTADKVAQILSRVQGQEYDITYWDPIDNAPKTIRCYTSNSAADLYSGRIKNGLYQGVKFNAIQIAGESDFSVHIEPALQGDELILTVPAGSTVSREVDDMIVEGADAAQYSIEGVDLIYEE